MWDKESEDASVRRVRRHPQPAVMGFDNRTAYLKTQAHTALFGREEGLENAVDVRRVEPFARILDRNQHTAALVAFACDPQFSWPIVHGAHGVDGITYEVRNDTIELIAVTSNCFEILGQFSLHYNAMPIKIEA